MILLVWITSIILINFLFYHREASVATLQTPAADPSTVLHSGVQDTTPSLGANVQEHCFYPDLSGIFNGYCHMCLIPRPQEGEKRPGTYSTHMCYVPQQKLGLHTFCTYPLYFIPVNYSVSLGQIMQGLNVFLLDITRSSPFPNGARVASSYLEAPSPLFANRILDM